MHYLSPGSIHISLGKIDHIMVLVGRTQQVAYSPMRYVVADDYDGPPSRNNLCGIRPRHYQCIHTLASSTLMCISGLSILYMVSAMRIVSSQTAPASRNPPHAASVENTISTTTTLYISNVEKVIAPDAASRTSATWFQIPGRTI